jgi:hypothetical protein
VTAPTPIERIVAEGADHCQARAYAIRTPHVEDFRAILRTAIRQALEVAAGIANASRSRHAAELAALSPVEEYDCHSMLAGGELAANAITAAIESLLPPDGAGEDR